jgi:hypothetical protein
MTRKHANDPISQIVDLGDGRYEFCYNQTTEQKEEHTDYIADYVVCDMPVNRQTIIDALIEKGHSEIEANELTGTL